VQLASAISRIVNCPSEIFFREIWRLTVPFHGEPYVARGFGRLDTVSSGTSSGVNNSRERDVEMFRKLALVLAAAATLTCPVLAQAGQFDKILVFGDSLSDDGNLYAMTGEQLLPPPYSQGRASNGDVWVEYLADELETPLVNMAFVGAQTGFGLQETPPSIAGPLDLTQGDLRIPAIGTQISQYLLLDKPTEDSLVVIWGGANDIFFGQANNFLSVNNISQHIRKLAQNGAETFLVPNMPPLEKTPFGLYSSVDIQLALYYLSIDFNERLQAELNSLEQELGVTIIQFDVHSLLNAVIADPSTYGFDDVETPSIIFGADPPEGYLFFDDVHPTTQGHAVLAEFAEYVIESALAP
jgi:outer membrane lipase/esterase